MQGLAVPGPPAPDVADRLLVDQILLCQQSRSDAMDGLRRIVGQSDFEDIEYLLLAEDGSGLASVDGPLNLAVADDGKELLGLNLSLNGSERISILKSHF
jgi:hypothetical protein